MVTGQVIDDRYEILQPLGEGGFGNVFLAVQRGFERRVALKILRGDFLDDEMQKRFHREAKLLSLMHHPNIALFVGSGLWDNKQYTALEFVAGETLHQRLLRGRLNGAEIKTLALGLLSGLAHAHSAGVIHRDLKPANIIIQQDSQTPKLIDFGLASTTIDQQKLTQEGCAVGTTLYMAPEQCMGQSLTSAADLYALGCILYQCTTGQAPFDADNAVAVMFKHLNEAPPTILTKTDTEAQFVEWQDKLLEKDPSERYATADDAMAALQVINLKASDFAQITTAKAKVKRNHKRFLWAWIAASACAALLIFALTFKQHSPTDNVNFGTPIALLEEKMSDKDLSNLIETRLNIIERAVSDAAHAETSAAPTFRNDVEQALDEVVLYTQRRKLNLQHKQALGTFLRLPWHATPSRRLAVQALNDLEPENAAEAGRMVGMYEAALNAMTPPETPADFDCIPSLYMRADYCAHQAGKYDEELDLLNRFVSYNQRSRGDLSLLAQSLTIKALLMSEKKMGSQPELIAAAQAAFEATAKTSLLDHVQRAIQMIQMARVMAQCNEYAKAVEYFTESHEYLSALNDKESGILGYTFGEQAECEQRLGRTADAAKSLAQGESILPTDVSRSNVSHGWFLMGGLREDRKEFATACGDYQKALACAKTENDRSGATSRLKWCRQKLALGGEQ